jgi:hypothetical protein
VSQNILEPEYGVTLPARTESVTLINNMNVLILLFIVDKLNNFKLHDSRCLDGSIFRMRSDYGVNIVC